MPGNPRARDGPLLRANNVDEFDMELVQRMAMLEERVDHIDKTLESVGADVHEMNERDKKRAGFVAGVVATVTLLWVAVTALLSFFFRDFG